MELDREADSKFQLLVYRLFGTIQNMEILPAFLPDFDEKNVDLTKWCKQLLAECR